MSNNEKYTIKELSFDEMLKDLSDTSPLMMSKKLIEYELHDQQDSIEVLNSIYEEFESRDNIIDNLVNPMLLSLADGLVKHPKLNGTFRKTDITPLKLVKEVNTFTYEQHSTKDIDNNVFLTQAEKTYYNNEKLGVDKDGKKYNKNYHRNEIYDIKSRNKTREEKGLEKDEVIGKDMDHVNPINHLRQKYQNNPYLYRDDIVKLVGMRENEEYINSSLNRSKGDKTWSEYIASRPKNENGDIVDNKGNILLTKNEQEQKIKLQEETTRAQNIESAKMMTKNIGLKGLGDIIILLLKPIWFEIKDMFKNGILYGFDTNDKIEAFLLRLKRVTKFINDNILNTLGDTLKDVLGNFIPMLISSLAKIVPEMFNKITQVISDGFMAIKEAFKIMMKPDSEVSQAQKADAITKIIASAVVPILIFSFEETVLTSLKFLDKTPLEFLKDVAMIILSGLATTLVVWLLDQIDLFSVKGEKRLARVKEIFELRIETIKKNTDIFEKTSIEILAKQKLQFKNIIANMNVAIDNNQNINQSVYELANFMQIDLKVKSTDEFLNLISNSKNLIIGEDNFQRDIKLSQLRQLLINYSLLKLNETVN
ncbi:hypothetical protein N5T77_09405 [Aliarcobacter cryaerophilus]|uniref:hypothetical protein n=1 Tax=Aliarcobacter cryaerophilus TaxID=28198 RepID=UPI0021B51946|nr:hypothetical protein [Aliarcobacter cryaerophilus]MCT7525261.1 hypothetical protein [Aliarcobacter cryaerophilus]